jgi:drug/metabolite transporter (DMT)-like permease
VLSNPRNPLTVSLAICLIGVLAISFGSVFAKFCASDLTPQGIAFGRLLVATIAFSLWSGSTTLYQRLRSRTVEPQPYSPRSVLLLLLAGMLWVLNLASIYWALNQTSVANTTALHNLAPVFTSFGAWWFWKRPSNRHFLGGVSLAIAGVFVLELEEMQISVDRIQGDGFAILSAVLLAAYLLIVEHLRRQFSSAIIQLWVCGTGVAMSFLFLVFSHEAMLPQSVQSGASLIAMGLICQFFGHGLLTVSLTALSSVTVSLVHLLEPVFSVFLAWLIFGECLSFWTWVGFIVILIGLYFTVLGEMSSEALEPELESRS